MRQYWKEDKKGMPQKPLLKFCIIFTLFLSLCLAALLIDRYWSGWLPLSLRFTLLYSFYFIFIALDIFLSFVHSFIHDFSCWRNHLNQYDDERNYKVYGAIIVIIICFVVQSLECFNDYYLVQMTLSDDNSERLKTKNRNESKANEWLNRITWYSTNKQNYKKPKAKWNAKQTQLHSVWFEGLLNCLRNCE